MEYMFDLPTHHDTKYTVFSIHRNLQGAPPGLKLLQPQRHITTHNCKYNGVNNYQVRSFILYTYAHIPSFSFLHFITRVHQCFYMLQVGCKSVFTLIVH